MLNKCELLKTLILILYVLPFTYSDGCMTNLEKIVQVHEPIHSQLIINDNLPNKQLPKWEKGFLDIHFISTGKGNSAFCLMPDGTSLLIDIGELPSNESERSATAVPDDNKSPAEWVADYIYQFHPDGRKAVLDYALITHFHEDHMGSLKGSKKIHKEGKYVLSGINELGSIIPIKSLIDRGYEYPINFKTPENDTDLNRMKGLDGFNEYWNFIEYQKATSGLTYEEFRVGSEKQITLKKIKDEFQNFTVKNLFANGDIASLYDTIVAARKFKASEYPGENNLSCGIKITYGKFDFYTGGDITGIGHTGETDFFSMESYAAPVIGQVDVATFNHHGNRDSQNEYYVRTIQPRVWIGQSWTVRHPGEEVLRRVTSKYVYPGERDIFTNFMHEANRIFLGNLVNENYKSTSGHIVIRVYPGGDKYDVFVLDDKTTERQVKYKCNYSAR